MTNPQFDFLTRLICAVSPTWGARRIASLARIESATRLYDAVKLGQYRPRRGGSWSGDAVMDAARSRLREYGRWLDENHDLATGILDDLVTNIVGCGVGIEPMAGLRNQEPATDFNDALRSLWPEWWERPDVTGEIPGPELERLVCRTWLRDGELFIQHSNKNSLTGIPYSLELLESDFVPFDLFERQAGVIHGIQKNVWGQPTAYYVFKQHPGNINSSAMPDYKIILAENMSHIKFSRRLHQTRGASIFHSVFTRLDDIKDIEESERIANRIAAAFCAFIKRESDFTAPSINPETNERNFEMAPGMIFDSLKPGEDVGIIDPKRPNPNLTTYLQEQIRRISAGVGTRYSSTAKNYNGTYSAQRQELVEGSAHYRRLFNYLAFQFYRPIWKRFIDACIGAGQLRLPANIDYSSLYRAEFRMPALPWIDPLKEINAYKTAIEIGVKSRQQVIRDMGNDPRAVDAQLAADPLDVRPSPGAATQPLPDEPIDDEEEDIAA